MPFRKGQSGNPKGRRKDPEGKGELKALARTHTKEAVETLVAVMKSADKDAARVQAATALLDRGWGRPEQRTEVTGAEGESLTVVVQLLPPE
jgi:hypothetical protein